MNNGRAKARARQTNPVTENTPKPPVTSLDVTRAQERLVDQVDSDRDLAYQAAHQAMLTMTRYSLLVRRAVMLGRRGGVSWDVMGGWLEVPGETLRRRYGDE